MSLKDPTWNDVVLALAAAFEGFSWGVAPGELRKTRGQRDLWKASRASKDPTTCTVLVEDSAAMLSPLVSFLGVYFGHRFHNPYLDGAASIVIGIILGVVAIVLSHESKGLLPEAHEQGADLRRRGARLVFGHLAD